MVANQLLFSLPTSPNWITTSSLLIGLIGLGQDIDFLCHQQDPMPSLFASIALLLLTLCLVIAHEWLHLFGIKLSCPIWARLHRTFTPKPVRLESPEGWPKFIRTALYTDMKMPTGILLTIATLLPLIVGCLVAGYLASRHLAWPIVCLFLSLQVGFALNDLRIVCLTIQPGRWYLDSGDPDNPQIHIFR